MTLLYFLVILYSHEYQCRIDINGIIKVTDFGLTEDMYASKYFRKDLSDGDNDEKVPLRWMAPESIDGDIYTEKTDVVSLWIYSCHVGAL